MPRYTNQQLQQLWVQGGGDSAAAPLMAAVGLAESGGDSNATNPSSGAAGIFQIYPPEPGSYDPLTNAQQAVRKYNTQGLGAWQAYTSGAYRRFLQPGGAAAVGATAGAAGGASAQGPCYIAGFGLFGACWCLDGVLGVAAFGAGIAILVLGLAAGERRFLTIPALYGGYTMMFFGAGLIRPSVQGRSGGRGPMPLMYAALGLGEPDLRPLLLNCGQGGQPSAPNLPPVAQPQPYPQPAPQPARQPSPLAVPVVYPRGVSRPAPQPAPANQLDRLTRQIQAVLTAAVRIPAGLAGALIDQLRRLLQAARRPGASPSAIQTQLDRILSQLRNLPGFQPPRAY